MFNLLLFVNQFWKIICCFVSFSNLCTFYNTTEVYSIRFYVVAWMIGWWTLNLGNPRKLYLVTVLHVVYITLLTFASGAIPYTTEMNISWLCLFNAYHIIQGWISASFIRVVMGCYLIDIYPISLFTSIHTFTGFLLLITNINYARGYFREFFLSAKLAKISP